MIELIAVTRTETVQGGIPLKHIKTVEDLERLQASNLLPKLYFLAIEEYFNQLKDGFDFRIRFAPIPSLYG